MRLPDSCHGDEGPPESFTSTFRKAGWKFIRVTLHVLKEIAAKGNKTTVRSLITKSLSVNRGDLAKCYITYIA